MVAFVGADLTQTYTSLTGAESGKVPSLGQIFWGNDGKAYKFVKYAEGTGALDLAVGDVVYYVDVTGYPANVVTADVSDSTGAEIGAGVSMAAVTATDTYFWIQIKGAATLAVALGGSAGDGDPLTAVGAADKALTKAAEADTAATYKAVVAFAYDASDKEIICDFPF